MRDASKRIKHDSFGLVQLSHTSGKASLFGSSVEHHAYITLRILKAEYERDELYQDNIYPNEPIIEVALSNAQLGDMLTSMNCASGVPCTILRMQRDGEYVGMEDPPVTSNQETYIAEFKEKLEGIGSKFKAVLAKARELEDKKAPSKKERQELSKEIAHLQQDIQDNLPFIYDQFVEKVEKVTSEAKSSIGAFQSDQVRQAGLKAISDQKLLEKPWND